MPPKSPADFQVLPWRDLAAIITGSMKEINFIPLIISLEGERIKG
jgi:hypothetical protein